MIILGVIVFAVLVIAAIGTYVLVSNQRAPEALDTQSQNAGIAFTPEELSGAWTSTTQSLAGYRVDEVLAGQDVTVVGRTNDVSGNVTIADSLLTEANVSVDLASIETDNSNRDSAFRDLLNTTDHPQAIFRLTDSVDLNTAEQMVDSESVKLQVAGELTAAGATVPVIATITATVQGETTTLNGSIPIVFEDFGITAPNLGFVTVQDQGTVEFSIEFTR